MRASTVLGFGWRRLKRHLALPLAPYVLAAVPALALAWLGTAGFSNSLDRSLHARDSAASGSLLAWVELLGTSQSGGFPWAQSLLLATLGLTVGQIFVAGGLVESLLERTSRKHGPFVSGAFSHAARFTLSFLWAALALVATLFASGLGIVTVSKLLEGVGPSAWLGSLAMSLLLALTLGVPLHLAYDLSRIAAASHDGRRCLRGLFSAWRHVLRHPMGMVPVYLFCATVAAAAGSLGWLISWRQLPASMAGLWGLFLAHQLGLLIAAASRCLLWSAAVGYYQAIGEPAWAGRSVAREVVSQAP